MGAGRHLKKARLYNGLIKGAGKRPAFAMSNNATEKVWRQAATALTHCFLFGNMKRQNCREITRMAGKKGSKFKVQDSKFSNGAGRTADDKTEFLNLES